MHGAASSVARYYRVEAPATRSRCWSGPGNERSDADQDGSPGNGAYSVNRHASPSKSHDDGRADPHFTADWPGVSTLGRPHHAPHMSTRRTPSDTPAESVNTPSNGRRRRRERDHESHRGQTDPDYPAPARDRDPATCGQHRRTTGAAADKPKRKRKRKRRAKAKPVATSQPAVKLQPKATPKPMPKRKPRKWTAAEKVAIGKRMKAYWAKRRKKRARR